MGAALKQNPAKAKLQSWYSLTLDIARLTNRIKEDSEELKSLDERIASSTIQKYEGMDMPRGGGTSDKTGDLAVLLAARRQELELSLVLWHMTLAAHKRELQDIEDGLALLNPRDAQIVKRFYLNGEKWESVNVDIKISKAQFYKIINKAAEDMRLSVD